MIKYCLPDFQSLLGPVPNSPNFAANGPKIYDIESNEIFSEDFVFGQSLSELELNEDNMEEIISRCRHLQVETIRFTRWRQMDMLEDFIKSQNGSFEAK